MKAKKVEKKPIRVVDSIPVDQRAKGVAVSKAATLVAQGRDVDKMPSQLVRVYQKVSEHPGSSLAKLYPKDAKTKKWPYEHFLIRILIKKGAVKAVEPKVTVTKDLSIAKAVAKKSKAATAKVVVDRNSKMSKVA